MFIPLQASKPGGQFTVQPYDVSGHIYEYATPGTPASTQTTTSVMEWSPNAVRFTVYAGRKNMSDVASAGTADVIADWVYTDQRYIPNPGAAKVHVDLWLGTAFTTTGSGSAVTATLHLFDFSETYYDR